MRYHFKPSELYFSQYGQIYECDHPVYNRCTLYKIGSYGLAVIQQRYDIEKKATYWTEIDDSLVDAIYLCESFIEYFKKHAKPKNVQNLYPTVTIRQIMWALRFKPLKREPWETVFDKCPI